MTTKQTLKVGSEVILLVGPKESRKKTYSVVKINGDRVFLDGYGLRRRTTKVTSENTETHRTVHHSVHISNVKLKVSA